MSMFIPFLITFIFGAIVGVGIVAITLKIKTLKECMRRTYLVNFSFYDNDHSQMVRTSATVEMTITQLRHAEEFIRQKYGFDKDVYIIINHIYPL